MRLELNRVLHEFRYFRLPPQFPLPSSACWQVFPPVRPALDPQAPVRPARPTPPKQEKAPLPGRHLRGKGANLVDPAGPTVSLISAEPVFLMAAALNACGYDEGLDESAPVRKRVRDEMNAALAKSEDARDKRDKLCLYIAQHRMTGCGAGHFAVHLAGALSDAAAGAGDLGRTGRDAAGLDAGGRDCAAAEGFCGGGGSARHLAGTHHIYDEEADRLHDPLSKMIVDTNLYLKMPASTYDGRRFMVVIEPHAFAAHGERAHLRHGLRGGGVAGERQDPHDRRAPHLPALHD